MTILGAGRTNLGVQVGDLLAALRTPAGKRTVAFLVALLIVLTASHQGTPRELMWLAFAVYALAAAIWVWGQHRDNLRGEPWTMPPLGLAVLALLAAASFGWRWLEGAGLAAAILSAAVPAYLLAGFLLMRFRAPTQSPTWGRRLVLSSLACGVIGFALLGRVWPALSGLALAFFVFLLLPGASVLAERRIRRLAAPSGQPPSFDRTSAILGAALFIALLAASRFFSGSNLVFPAFAALALLVFAVVSSTLLDVVLILGVVAFIGITPRQETPVPAPEESDGTLVALGDSYMSGEGADTFFEGTDEGGGNGCRRSPTAWAAEAGRRAPFTGVAFLACSGARTYHVRLPASDATPPKPHEQRDEGDDHDSDEGGTDDTQLQQYVDTFTEESDRNPALVVLSIGGNDAGFGTIGVMCVAPGDCSERQDLWFRGLDQVEENLDMTYAEVRATFPQSRILVVPYPDPIYGAEEAEGSEPAPNCDQVALAAGERRFIGDFVAELNDRVEAAARAPGIDFDYLAGMESVLADSGLQLCHPGNEGAPGLNFIGLRSVSGDPSQRFNPANWTHNSLHPNERGHAAMLRLFQCWADAEFDADSSTHGDDCGTKASGRDVPDVEASEACDIYGELEEEYYSTSKRSCIAEGQDWAAEQAGWRGGVIAAGVVLAGFGVWLLSTAFFAWRRASR